MDSLNYIILCLLFITLLLFSVYLYNKTQNTVSGLVTSSLCLISGISSVFFYIKDMYFTPITTEGIRITGNMHTFMLDDTVTPENEITGIITLSVYVAACISAFVYWIIKTVKKAPHKRCF